MADGGGDPPAFCLVVGSGMVGSACAASAAALGRGQVILVGPACQPSCAPPFSSHDDYSRVVSVLEGNNIGGAPAVRDLALESARSIGEYRGLEEETGVRFYHETGYFKAAPCDGSTDAPRNDLAECARRWPFIEVSALAGDAAAGALQASGAGWIDPRAHVRAVRRRCEARGVRLVDEVATSLVREDGGSGLWRVTTAAGTELRAPRVALAVGSFINLSGLLPRGVSVDIQLWGKAVYHGRVSHEDAASLLDQGMPVVSVSSPAGHGDLEGATNVSYNGAKAGTYVYFFPPCQYEDGHWYIKIGHSPFDPLIDDLEGADTAEKLERWMAGKGDDVIKYTAKSEEYYSRTLAAVLPSVTFVAGGYVTRCVTSRTCHGDPLIGPLRLPYGTDVQCGAGLFVCAGCNGAGAKFALEWGRQLAEDIAREPTVTESFRATRTAQD